MLYVHVMYASVLTKPSLLQVHRVIHREKSRANNHQFSMPSTEPKCRLQVCPLCRMVFSERAYLSLNGIANGDIPASAATGYGFHLHAQRPIAPPDIVKNLGLRPVPMVSHPLSAVSTALIKKQGHCATPPTLGPLASRSVWSLLDILEEPAESVDDPSFEELPPPALYSTQALLPQELPDESSPLLDSSELQVRPPWTPPPSPSLGPAQSSPLGLHSPVCDGRR